MDPLSPAASCLAVLGLIIQTLRAYNALRHAPEDVLAVCEELEEFQRVFGQSQEAIQRRLSAGDLTQRSETALHHTSKSIYDTLTQLERILRRCVDSESNHESKKHVSRIAWLRNSEKIKKLCLRLRNLEVNLVVLAASQLVSDNVDTNVFLQNMAQGSLTELLSRQQFQEQALAEILHGQRLLHDSISFQAMDADAGYTSTPFTTSFSHTVRKRKRSIAANPPISRAHGRSFGLEDLKRDCENDDIFTEDEFKCQSACSCVCHRPSKLGTPALLESIFGTFHIGLTGALTSRTPCTERLCRRQHHRTARFVYRFPSWMLARAISFSYSTRSTMQIVLRAPRIISDDAPILRFAASRNLESIRKLMSSGLASPADVGASYGLTALHIAFVNKDVEMCGFLVQHGADPYYETNLRRAVIDIIRDELINGKITDDQKEEFDCVFDELDDYESFNLSPLHKTVVGLSRVSLEMQLSTSTKHIDVTDSLGRTVLSAAAWRGDAKSVCTLLRFGASANICTPTELSPLHRAIEGRSYECVELLIQYGANVNHRNKRGRLPLHFACRIDDDAKICELLLRSGAIVDGEDHGKGRPLHEAVVHGKIPQLKALLKYGADVNCQTVDCEFPLNIAIAKNNVEAIHLLLNAGATQSLATMAGRTIVHTAAECANSETLLVLAGSLLKGLNGDEKDNEDCTPSQLFDARCEVEDVDLRAAFVRLLESVRCAEAAESYFEKDDVEEFHDALTEVMAV